MCDELGITLWNATGITKESIDYTIQHINPKTDLFFITETWLLNNNSIKTSWTQHHNYGTKATNSHRGTGGISLLINPDFKYTVIKDMPTNKYALTCRIKNYVIICFYIPPTPTISTTEFIEIINTELSKHTANENIILCGDFNCRMGEYLNDRHMVHNRYTYITNQRCNPFINLIAEHGLKLWNKELAFGKPTYYRGSTTEDVEQTSIIDLFLSNKEDFIINPYMEIHNEASLGSDHKLVFFSFVHTLPPPTIVTLYPRQLWKIYKFKIKYEETEDEEKNESSQDIISEGDTRKNIYILKYREIFTQNMPQIKKQIKSINLKHNTTNIDEIQEKIDQIENSLCDLIYKSLDESIKRQTPRPKTWNWFWTEELQKLSEKRESLYKKWKRATGINKAQYWKEHLDMADIVRNKIKSEKNRHFRTFCTTVNSCQYSEATKKIKTIRRSKGGFISFESIDGPQDAVDKLTENWKNIFSGNTRNKNIESLTKGNKTPLEGYAKPLPFSLDTILDSIKRLPNNKAPGIDHLKAEMFKPISDIIAPILFDIFNICWKFTVFPNKWNIAQVIPIYKKGDPQQVTNYRPISLICVTRKILEFSLHNSLLQESIKLDPVQGGFREQRSTMDQALILQELIIQHKSKTGKTPVVALLDIKSAYDVTDRNIIWNSLYNDSPISSPFLFLLKKMFDEVQIEVIQKGLKSTTPFKTDTGVLQGSTLSPHLYSIFINSLPETLRDAAGVETTTINYDHINYPINSLLFADDVACIGSPDEIKNMLILAQEHSIEFGYRWNPLKSYILSPEFSSTQNTEESNYYNTRYEIYDQEIAKSTSCTYLGIIFNSKGIDDKQMILHNATKGSQAMKILQSIGVNDAGLEKFLSLRFYKSFIRPIFEYGLSLITTTKKNIKLLENAQDNAIRIIFNGHKTSSTQAIRHMNKMPTIEERMVILQAKNINRSYHLPIDSLLNNMIHQILTTRNTYFKKIQKNNIIWQSLPLPPANSRVLPTFITSKMLEEAIFKYLKKNMIKKQSEQFYVGMCRTSITIDPIMYLPMHNVERSRLIRWRMGWLPGRPKPCQNCYMLFDHKTTRNHLTHCLQIHNIFHTPVIIISPVDQLLNQLPTEKPINKNTRQQLTNKWKLLTKLLYRIEEISLKSEEEMNPDPEEVSPFITWLQNEDET